MCTGTQDISPILTKDSPPDSEASRFWILTENKLSKFLPELLGQLFPTKEPIQPSVSPSDQQSSELGHQEHSNHLIDK